MSANILTETPTDKVLYERARFTVNFKTSCTTMQFYSLTKFFLNVVENKPEVWPGGEHKTVF
jgi:hypothetical protein